VAAGLSRALVLVEDPPRGVQYGARLAATLLLVVLFVQIGLGIATLLLAVPVGWVPRIRAEPWSFWVCCCG
jgi:heme A synthase